MDPENEDGNVEYKLKLDKSKNLHCVSLFASEKYLEKK